ncbi:MAG TPA: flagellar biosynthetic protein FliP, partial [Pseudoxanthomonas mexicana]|nr:flagellar biosynthetic protein FliP [Pseudoxanthomonas mexicana]
MRRLILSLLCLLWLSAPMLALAQTAPTTPQSTPAATPAAPAAPSAPTLPTLPKVNVGQVGDNTVSLPLQTLLLMTSLSFLPAALL